MKKETQQSFDTKSWERGAEARFQELRQRFEGERFSADFVSIGKKSQEDNEDRILVSQDSFTVVDGMTDKSGRKYPSSELKGKEVSGGRLAAEIIARVISGLTRPLSGQELVNAINREFQRVYQELDIYDEVSKQENALNRFTGILCHAQIIGDQLVITQVGEVGFRINGGETSQPEKWIDDVNAEMRSIGYRLLQEAHPELSDEALLKHARAVAEWGVEKISEKAPETAHLLGQEGLLTIRTHVEGFMREKFSEDNRGLPPTDIERYVKMAPTIGIKGQGKFQNADDPVFGHPGIDGFSVPQRFISVFRFPLSDIRKLEIFSDGYFEIPAGSELKDWEVSFRKVELTDLPKIKEHKSTKGSTWEQPTDDRSAIVARFK